MTKKIKIATRASKLALWQSEHIASKLKSMAYDTELVLISTHGDREQSKPLHEIGGKAVFIKELEDALLRQKADIAVHSLKDLPATLPNPFSLTGVLKREFFSDILVLSKKNQYLAKDYKNTISQEEFSELPIKKIATGSLRRKFLCQSAKQDLVVEQLRGNVDTRLRHLEQHSDWDGIIMAEAAFKRMGFASDYSFIQLDPNWFIPCAGQGAIAVESLASDNFATNLCSLFCNETLELIQIERSFLSLIGASCSTPIGVFAFKQNDQYTLKIIILSSKDNFVFADVTSNLPSELIKMALKVFEKNSSFKNICRDLNLNATFCK